MQIAAIHVSGFSHTGTSLLVKIIRQHPQVCSLKGEHNFFTLLPRIQQKFPDLAAESCLRDYLIFVYSTLQRGAFRAMSEEQVVDERLDALLADLPGGGRVGRNHVDVFYEFAARYCQYEGKTMWIAKVKPAHLGLLRPSDRIIATIRDPRAIVSSRMVRSSRDTYSPIIDSLVIRSYLKKMRSFASTKHDAPASTLVRYEDLVREPVSVCERLFQFLNLEFDPSFLKTKVFNSAYAENTQKEGIVSDSVDKWRAVLSDHEVQLVQSILWKEMATHSYEPIGSRRAIPPIRFRDVADAVRFAFSKLQSRSQQNSPGYRPRQP